MAIGEVDLRSSRICQSNWARITVYQSCSYVNIYVNVKRTQQTYQGREYGAVEEPYVVSNPGCMSMYSMTTSMVYAPGGVKTQACGGIDGYGGSCTKLI
jgi:hypothetical protein